MLRRPENSALLIAIELRDENDVLTVPTSLHYRIDDDASGANILDWTPLTPASTAVITITATQNAIHNRINLIERRTVTVNANSGLVTEWTDEYPYELMLLSGLN